jgi:hypothetical protein
VPQIGTPFANNSNRAADIEAYGQSLDRLRARFNPVFAVISQYKQAVLEARQAEQLGAISTDEMTAAIGRQRQATLASIAAIKTRQAANSNTGSAGGNRLSGNQLQNLGFQANDVITMAALGASPGQIAFSQGGQILQALQQGEGGLSGSLSAIKGSAAAAGTALLGTLGTVGLISTGFGVAAVAAGAFYLATREKAKDLKEATDAQRQAVEDLAKAYVDAKTKKDDFYRPSVIAAEAEARRTTEDLRKSADAEGKALQSQLGSPFTIGRGRETFFGVKPEFAQFGEAISILNGQIERGVPNYQQFEKSIAGVVANNPGLQTTGDKILGIVAAASAAAGQLKTTSEYLKDINRSSVGNFDRTQQAGRDQSVMSQRFGDDPFAAAREQQRQKEISLTQAQDDRKRSLDRTLASAQLDIDLVGQSTAAIEAQRLAAQLEGEVREQAARNNVKADEAEIASIHQKAIEYGKLKAIQEALATIHSQVQDIELQRVELGLIGQNTLAHDRAIASFKAEQQIRQLGIPLYGAEAEAIRKNTAELSSLAEASAKAKLARSLQFEREQMFRSQIEQTVASTMQSAGLDYDPNSLIAQQIRYNEQLKATKSSWEDIFNTVNDGIDGISDALFSGGSITDALKKAGQQLAKTVFDMSVTNPIKNWLTGGNFNTIADLGIFGNGATSGKGGGFGGVLGQMLGAQKAVASMQVQAASVFINGSPLGVPGLGSVGNLLGGNGSTFTPNTTLTDILTGGGGVANQNVIQNRIDQAFGTNGIAQDLIQSRIDQAFGPANNAFGTIFSSGIGGSTSSLTGSMAQYASAIKSIESAGSGGYSALGPMLKNGNQALGAYQVMKSNLPSWSTQAFGSPMSPQQFLGNPAAQDTVFEQQFGKLLSKYGNSNDAASAWFTGGPLSSRAGASDILGTTGSQYVDKFNAALGQATQNVGQLGGASSGALSSLVSSTSQAAGGLNQLGSGAGKLGSMLSQFPAAPGGGGGGLGGLGSLFGSLFGGGASIGSMNAISPAATANILSGSWGLFAKGAAFNRGNVVPFAKGDVFSSPTYFPMSAGRTGVMGEDGDEAIMPLQRGPDGRLGVVNHQPLRAPRAANGNAAGGGTGGGLTRAHIEGIVNSIADKLKLNANIINLNDGSDIKRYLMSEDGHETVAIVNRRNGAGG